MEKIKFNGHTLEVYDSIQELPISRFQMYNLNLMIDAGVGSDINDFDVRCNKVRQHMKKDVDLASKELFNLQQLFRLIVGNMNPKMRAFIVMIHKIDGRVINDEDLSDDGINDIISELGKKRFSFGIYKSFMNRIKKKIDYEFDAFFPKMVNTPQIKEFYSKLKLRSMLMLREIAEAELGSDYSGQLKKLEDYLFGVVKPKKFSGHDGVEVQSILRFEETCVLLSQNKVSVNPRGMTTLSFYKALDVVAQQLKTK